MHVAELAHHLDIGTVLLLSLMNTELVQSETVNKTAASMHAIQRCYCFGGLYEIFSNGIAKLFLHLLLPTLKSSRLSMPSLGIDAHLH